MCPEVASTTWCSVSLFPSNAFYQSCYSAITSYPFLGMIHIKDSLPRDQIWSSDSLVDHKPVIRSRVTFVTEWGWHEIRRKICAVRPSGKTCFFRFTLAEFVIRATSVAKPWSGQVRPARQWRARLRAQAQNARYVHNCYLHAAEIDK